MLAVSLLDLGQGLGVQESAHAVSGHEGEAGLEEIQTTERRELVEHHQELVFAALGAICVELLVQPAPDLVEDQAHERLGPRNVRWRSNFIERDGVAGLGHLGNETGKASCRDRGGQYEK